MQLRVQDSQKQSSQWHQHARRGLALGSLLLTPALLASVLFTTSGCQDAAGLRSRLNSWARKNSIKNNGTELAEGECPDGTVAQEKGPDGKALWCKSVDDPKGLETSVRRYPNGQPESEMTQIGEGLIITKYYQSGHLKEQTNYLSAQKHGPWIEWDEDGNKVTEANFREGKLSGPYITRDRDGKVIQSGFYRDGKKAGVWSDFDSGRLKSRVTWSDDQPNGNAEYYSAEGKLKEHGALINGERSGRWVFYNQEGRQNRYGVYVNGKEEGIWVQRDQYGGTNTTYYRLGQAKERPRLAANLPVEAGDTLGAPPPMQRSPEPVRQAKQKKGWIPM